MQSTNKMQMCCAFNASNARKFVTSDEDRAAVDALPYWWVPRRGGPILSNYLKHREQEHQTVLQSLSEDAAKLNAEIDVEIRILAQNLQIHIRQNQTDIQCIIESCNAVEYEFMTETRDEALKKVNQLTSQRVENAAKFKGDALALEMKRGVRLRQLLRDYFQRLAAVGNQTSKDLLHDFDKRAYEANQQLLSNCRAYTELETRLRIQADESVVRAMSSLNHQCLGVRLSLRKQSSLRSTSKISIRGYYSASDAGNRESWFPSITHFPGIVDEFSKCVELIVDAFKSALCKIFNGFSGKLIDLRKGLGKRDREQFSTDFFESSELRLVIERNLSRLSGIATSKQPCSKEVIVATYFDALTLQKAVANLKWNLRMTFDILNDAGHVWDAHIKRSAFAQKLMMAAVEDLLTSNDSHELANEIPFNIALEKMRTSADPKKLDHYCNDLTVLLDKTAELYLRHSVEEVGLLEEFMNLSATMAKTLLAEFDCFLERHPRGYRKSIITALQGILSHRKESVWLTQPLNRVTLQSEIQSLALQNWKNGFLESFQSNVSLVPDELKRQARSWVEEKKAIFHVQYSMKIMSHSIRLERVKAAREMRRAEVNFHNSRLTSHLGAIFRLIESFTKETSQFLLSITSPSLYPFCDWMARLQVSKNELLEREPLDPETKRLVMSSYPPRLVKHRTLFEASVDEAIEKYKMSIEQRLQVARKANFQFISALKLFGEGGNYSCQEASRTAAALVQASKTLEDCVTMTYYYLARRRSELLNKADELMGPSGLSTTKSKSLDKTASSKKLKK